MPRLSTLSNPTGLVEIEKSRVTIVVDDAKKALTFSLVSLDLSNLTLPSPLNVVVIARRGNAEERLELGSALAWDRGFRTLSELGDDGTLAFRVLLLQPGSAKLVAAAENVRPDGQGDSSSFIALEPADLGQRPWEVEILELEGRAVIRFSRDVYNSAGEAESDKFFMGMVLPEAVRRLSEWVAKNAPALDETAWEPFKTWLSLHGVTEDPDEEREELQREWCNDVVEAFCNRFEFASQLRELRTKGMDE
ncbi:MAG: hypothetical protein IV093_13995 [Rubrivivax sp.]|nr:hypothetical protein [Rubrivivax sp.]